MDKQSLSNIVKSVRTSMRKHSPEILTGIGIAGMITTTVMAVRATPKALQLIQDAEETKSMCTDESGEIARVSLAPFEAVKAAWKCYIPATVVGAMSVLCLIGATSTNLKRNTALATAYTLSESAFKEYQEKVVETVGEKKEQSVRDAIAKEKVNNNPPANREVVITEKGNTLCLDVLSGRYFKSDIGKLKKVENELNRRMRDEMYISLNDFYYEIGLNGTKLGDTLGWNIENGYIDLNFSSQLADDETPCLVIDYRVAPRYDFQH